MSVGSILEISHEPSARRRQEKNYWKQFKGKQGQEHQTDGIPGGYQPAFQVYLDRCYPGPESLGEPEEEGRGDEDGTEASNKKASRLDFRQLLGF